MEKAFRHDMKGQRHLWLSLNKSFSDGAKMFFKNNCALIEFPIEKRYLTFSYAKLIDFNYMLINFHSKKAMGLKRSCSVRMCRFKQNQYRSQNFENLAEILITTCLSQHVKHRSGTQSLNLQSK